MLIWSYWWVETPSRGAGHSEQLWPRPRLKHPCSALRLAEDTAPPVKSSCWEPRKLFRAEAVALRRGSSRGNGWGLRRDGRYRPNRAKGTGVLIRLFLVWPIDQRRWTAGHCVWICKWVSDLYFWHSVTVTFVWLTYLRTCRLFGESRFLVTLMMLAVVNEWIRDFWIIFEKPMKL